MLKIPWHCYEVQVPISMSLSENVLAFSYYENAWAIMRGSFFPAANLNLNDF